MAPSFAKFAVKTIQSARTSATKTKTNIFVAVSWIVSTLACFGVSLSNILPEISKLTWIGTAVLLVAFIIFLFYHAYCVYSESETEKDRVTKDFDSFKRPKVEIIGTVECLKHPVAYLQVYCIRVKNTVLV